MQSCMDGEMERRMTGSCSSIPAAKSGLIVLSVQEPLNTSFKSDKQET